MFYAGHSLTLFPNNMLGRETFYTLFAAQTFCFTLSCKTFTTSCATQLPIWMSREAVKGEGRNEIWPRDILRQCEVQAC